MKPNRFSSIAFFLAVLTALLASAVSPNVPTFSSVAGPHVVYADGGDNGHGHGDGNGNSNGNDNGNDNQDGNHSGSQSHDGNGNSNDSGGHNGNANSNDNNNNDGHHDGNGNGNSNDSGHHDGGGTPCGPGKHEEDGKCVPNGDGHGNCGQNQGNGNNGKDNGYGHSDDCGDDHNPPPTCETDPSKCPPPTCETDPSKCPPPDKCKVDPKSCLPPVIPPQDPKHSLDSSSLSACVEHPILLDSYSLSRHKWDVLLFGQSEMGKPQFLRNLTSELEGNYRYPTISPDNCKFAVAFTDGDRKEVRVYNFAMQLLQTIVWNGGATQPEFLTDTTLAFVGTASHQIVFFDLAGNSWTVPSGAIGQMPNSTVYDGMLLIAYTDPESTLAILTPDGYISHYGATCYTPEWIPGTNRVLCHTGTNVVELSVNGKATTIASVAEYGNFMVTSVNPDDQTQMIMTNWNQLAYNDHGNAIVELLTGLYSGGSDWGR